MVGFDVVSYIKVFLLRKDKEILTCSVAINSVEFDYVALSYVEVCSVKVYFI
jgi:hypothetical protein